MGKIYLPINVWEATQQRLDFIFSEFKHVIIAFSGGKDSGLLLHIVMDYIKKNNIDIKPALFHQDMEAQYRRTTEYVEKMFEKFKDDVEPFWFCQPIASRTAVSNEEMFWYTWDDTKPEIWVREMPKHEYVYTLENNPFKLYKYRMDYLNHAKQFSRWWRMEHNDEPTAVLLGLRAQESLNRYAAISDKRYPYKGRQWITKDFSNVYSCSPLYDWTTEDIWTANAKFGYDYNEIYDLFYMAGVSIHDMRVASPFHDDAVASLNLYRVLEPDTWCKLLGRVKGANFAAIYGRTKAMGYRNVTLPPGHTWKSYTKFLLKTLPPAIRNNYIEKFITSIKFWHRTGGGFSDDIIEEIRECGYGIEENGVSNYSKDKKKRIIFHGMIPDDTDDVKGTIDIPSWKRMCCCILKNDHTCKFMGFGLTKQQQARVNAIKEKYKNI